MAPWDVEKVKFGCFRYRQFFFGFGWFFEKWVPCDQKSSVSQFLTAGSAMAVALFSGIERNGP